LEVKSLSGDNFEKITKLNMNTKKSAVFVQTDKSIYKPADKVQFRVLVLNAETKPYKNANVTVFISDGAQNRVKQFDNTKMTNGVFQNELQLSDSPVMGIWKIHVKVNNGKDTTKDFEVAEYTLPNFEVTIDANPDANFKDGKIRATVRAKYTFGKIAKGNATVTAEVSYPAYQRYWRTEESKKVSKSVAVDGKKPIEFDIVEELGIKDKNEERNILLFATFKEELTEREQNATTMVKIHITPHKIDLEKSSDKFKPGLPFSVSAVVKFHDKNAPVSDKFNPLKFTIKFYYDIMRSCNRRRYDYNHWSETRDQPPSFTTETYECREEKSHEEKKEVFLTNGISKIDIDIPSNTTRIDVEAKYLETEGSSRYIQRSESASNEFIQIKSATER
jgi:CD109 antigen